MPSARLRPLGLLLFVTLASNLTGACASATATRPNVLIFLTDDQGWGDLSIHGNTNLATPHIDSIARDGALFDRFYVSPVCSPTRAEFLTGRYHPRGGVYGTSAKAERLNLDEKTVAQTFKASGYATAAFGKWHSGSQNPYHPNARGFDEYYGVLSGHWPNYFDTLMDHNGQSVRGKGFIADDLTDHAIAFIEQKRNQPFFVYLPFNTPHAPMQVPGRFYDKFANAPISMRNRDPEKEDVPFTRAALAMVENVDWNVGRVLERLEKLGLAQETMVLFFSDNGPNSWRWNGDMKGRKGSIDEGGIRSPFMIRWPGQIRPGTRVPQIAAAIDLLPTLADLAGIPITSDKPLDGKSVKPLLMGNKDPWPDRQLFAFRGKHQVSVRTQQYRLDGDGALFDIVADPGQRTDVSAQHPDIATQLRAAAAQMDRDVLAKHGQDDRPLPVGHTALTALPAGDGTTDGTVARSNKAPNSSYFMNWSRTTDSVTWDIEVAQAGNYEVMIEYACPAADLGAMLELTFGSQRISTKVTEAHDPPLLGAEHDRTPRTESFYKDWKPMSLGTIRLEASRGPLVLRATEIPGKQAAEIASITLIRR